MPNIRSIRDLPSNQQQPQAIPVRRGVYARQQDDDSQHGWAQGYDQPDDGSPLPTIGSMMCPSFKLSLFSFIFTISVVQIAVFIATLIVASEKFEGAFVKGNDMIGPGPDVFLFMGGKYTPYIKDGAIWRLLVPIFLHGGIVHILFNLFFQCNMGFRIEEIWGVKRLVAIYFLSGIGGNLLSAVCNTNSVSVGASGALFGILGGQLAYIIMNWSEVPNAAMAACSISVVVFVNLLFGFSGLVDNYAHLGGLISGFCLNMARPLKISSTWADNDYLYRNAGIGFSIMFYLLTILLLFLVV